MMRKAEKYDWKDSNVELIGSTEDRSVKKSSAETEKAWIAAKTCNHAALFIWRIEVINGDKVKGKCCRPRNFSFDLCSFNNEYLWRKTNFKFKVVEWPKVQYGEFYEGDSYIVLNIYQKEKELNYDVHFWIGKYSTQDEYGAAAYKTVELDTLLDDKPVQHREVQHYESNLFKSYFPNIVYLKGGHESGFRHVITREYVPRLLHFKGDKRNIIITEISATKKNLKSDDVFIYDTGSNIFQWIGKGANKDEKYKAQQFAQQLNADRNGKLNIEVLDEEETPSNHEFFKHLSNADPDDEDQHQKILNLQETQLFKISDASGSLNFEKVASGKLNKSNINEDDVFIVDNGQAVFVYVGEESSPNERKNALIYAHNYLKETAYPQAPVTVINKDVKGANAENFRKIIEN